MLLFRNKEKNDKKGGLLPPFYIESQMMNIEEVY